MVREKTEDERQVLVESEIGEVPVWEEPFATKRSKRVTCVFLFNLSSYLYLFSLS